MNKGIFAGILLLVAAIAGGIYFFQASAVEASTVAQFKVGKLTCGACVRNIQQALQVAGVGEVQVDVASGRAEVAFDPDRVAAADIAGLITAAGYPAEVLRVQTAAAVRDRQQENAQLAAGYVGRIGGRLISREEFDQQVAAHRPEGNPPEMEPALRQSVWQKLLERELLLAEAVRNGGLVSAEEVSLELERMRSRMEGFDQKVSARFGSVEAFASLRQQLLTINRHIEQQVLQGVEGEEARSTRLAAWYSELVKTTPVEVFDPVLLQKPAPSNCCG